MHSGCLPPSLPSSTVRTQISSISSSIMASGMISFCYALFCFHLTLSVEIYLK
ncbi:hypothetical protein KSP39_PZI000873 [Platanthera zijinensis]|uniref:Uncharacterized protein n=1 Tax=Platanthera zijinensis TaxID=2320716 RepID=A0AAP0C0G9_9ASPA